MPAVHKIYIHLFNRNTLRHYTATKELVAIFRPLTLRPFYLFLQYIHIYL